jgi:hypothetical protein
MLTLDLINYYIDLLIVQYHDLPNAQQFVGLFISIALSDQIIQTVLDPFNLPLNYFDPNADMYQIEVGGTDYLQGAPPVDIAVQNQLNILGKYVGIPRIINGLDLGKTYFACPSYSDDASLYNGFQNYAGSWNTNVFFEKYAYASTYALSDYDMQSLILAQIKINAWDGTFASADNVITDIFQGACVLTDNQDMTITYAFDPTQVTDWIRAVVFVGCLPAPSGVGIIVTGV